MPVRFRPECFVRPVSFAKMPEWVSFSSIPFDDPDYLLNCGDGESVRLVGCDREQMSIFRCSAICGAVRASRLM